jgi:hypothetical protein
VVRHYLSRAWESPVITSWASQGIRLSGMAVVWPLVLRDFSAAEVVLWQIFATLAMLQTVADFGFAGVLARFSAAAASGPLPGETSSDSPGVRRAKLHTASTIIYQRLTWWGSLVLLPTSFVVAKKISELETGGGHTSEVSGWMAWSATAVAFVLSLRTGGWSALLQGDGRLARVRRMEAFIGLVAILAMITGLVTVGGLLPIAFATLGSSIASAVWCWKQVRQTGVQGSAQHADGSSLPMEIWARAWRAGIGLLFASGVSQAAALVIAAEIATAEAAAYMIGWRAILVASQLSQAPFYGRLPEFGRLAAAGAYPDLLALSRFPFASSLGLFTSLFLLLGFTGPWLLRTVGAEVAWPSAEIWVALGLAIFFERYGAMHLQLHTLSHTVRWHVANGISGLIAVAVMLISQDALGVMAVPVGLGVGYIFFYCPYARMLSRSEYRWTWGTFDWPATVWLCVMLFGSGLILW